MKIIVNKVHMHVIKQPMATHFPPVESWYEPSSWFSDWNDHVAVAFYCHVSLAIVRWTGLIGCVENGVCTAVAIHHPASRPTDHVLMDTFSWDGTFPEHVFKGASTCGMHDNSSMSAVMYCNKPKGTWTNIIKIHACVYHCGGHSPVLPTCTYVDPSCAKNFSRVAATRASARLWSMSTPEGAGDSDLTQVAATRTAFSTGPTPCMFCGSLLGAFTFGTNKVFIHIFLKTCRAMALIENCVFCL